MEEVRILIACECSGVVREAFKYAYADKSQGQAQRAKIRSRTFHGIANAMADQWNFKKNCCANRMLH